MSLIDIFQMAFHNLWQRKLRTTLNLIGVVIGNTILLLALAGTNGVRTAVHALFDASEIVVSAAMSEDRRKRIEAALENNRMMERSFKDARLQRPTPLDWTSYESLNDLEHVVSVIPLHRQPCRVSHKDLSHLSELVSADIRSSIFSKRLLAGTMLSESDSQGILIDEFLA